MRRLFYKKERLGKTNLLGRTVPVSQTIFENGGQRTSISGNLENFSTQSPHAYRGGGGVANTPSAYKRPAPRTARKTTTKRERRFQIFRRK